MGNDLTPNNLRGLLVPWPFKAANLWNGESTFTQLGPHAGVPNASGQYDMVIQATGEQAADSDIKILTQQAGQIGQAKFVWKNAADTLYYGRDGGNVISYWEIVTASTSSTTYRDVSDCLGLSNGKAIVLSRDRIVGTNYKAVVSVRNIDGSYSSTDLLTQSNDKPMHGALCLLPDGSILAAHYVANTTNNTAQVMVHRSEDDGSTWSTISRQALPETIDIGGTFGAGNSGYDLSRLRMAYSQGQILLCCGLRAHNTSLTNGDVIGQYASIDNGGSFIFVVTSDGGQGYYSYDILVKNNAFYLTYIASNNNAKILPLEHAFVSIDKVRGYGTTYNIYTGGITIAAGLTNGYWTQGQLSCWVDEDGRFYASLEDLDHDLMTIGYSDNTQNWFYTGGNGVTSTNLEDGRWYDIGTATTMISAHAGCSAAGRQIVFHNFIATGPTTTYHASLCAAYLGGWSGVTMPQLNAFPEDYQYAGFSFNWLPFNLPDDTGHYTVTGAGSATLGSGKITTSSATTQDKYFESPAMGSGVPVLIRARCKPLTQGTLTGGRGFEFRSGIYWGAVFIDTTRIALYDMHASAQVGSHYTFGANSEIDILFGMDDAFVYLWAMISSKNEKQWVLVANGSLSSGSGIGSARIRWGDITSLILGGGTTLDTEWYEFHYAFGTATGDGLQYGQDNPSEVKGRLYPPQSQYCYIAGGMSISTYEGPAYEGDNYQILTAYNYPIDRVFYDVSPSPRNRWRSLSVGSGNVAEQKISIFLDDNLANNADSNFGSDLIGFHFQGINWRGFELHRRDTTAGSWQLIGAFNNQVVSHAFSRVGASIKSSSATGPYLQFNECQDWYAILVSGETTVVRKLRTNSEGVFSNSATTKQAILQIDEPVHSDPTSGTMHLVPNSCTVIADLQGNTGSAIRLTINAQKTAENYLMMGNMSIGSVVIPAYQYSRGRTISFDSGVAVDIQDDGTQRVRDNQAGGRAFRFAWSEGVDITDLFADPASPDYYKATTAGSSVPIAAYGSAPTAMMGIIRHLQGPKTPLVYLPKIPKMSSPTNTLLLNRRMQHALCTLEGEISIENILGDELENELMRVATVQLREVR